MQPKTLFSADPDLHGRIAARLDDIVSIARADLGDSLVSVLLGGSLARGEAFGVRDRGELYLLSDLDLYFVADGKHPGLLARIDEYARRDPFLLVRPDAAVVPRDFFTSAPTAMPTHQLAHAHVVLWGEAVSIAAAKDTAGAKVVDPDDAAALLFNRFVEALDPALDAELPRLMHRTKEFIDAPMAWLGARRAYTPDRAAQVEHLRKLGAGWSSAPAEHLDAALNHWSACLQARRRGVVDMDELRLLGDAEAPGWFDWTGGFALALLTGQGIEAIHDTLRDGLDPAVLELAVEVWLGREPWPSRLRRARQWQGIAPERVTSWLQHGRGGAGPDRIFAAACLCYHGSEAWKQPLEGLLHDPVQTPADLYRLWWEWIQGRRNDG